MSRISYCIILIGLFSIPSFGQLNTTLSSTVSYSTGVNDIWGYAAGGREYALVGLKTGVNIQDVTDPANPVDLGTASGANSSWRDIKTHSTYAYVSNENNSGIMVIDLSNLPTSITSSDYWNWEPVIDGTTLETCHNLYIDASGYMYMAGTNLNSGGILYADVFTDPANPAYVDKGVATYAHDVFVDGNTMYASEIYQGQMEIYDVTNKTNTVSLGNINTPFNFTHNIWTGGNIAFTTDEKANAPTASYDVSDPNNIVLLDEFKPLGSLNTGVVPHNAHVLNDYVIISHYSDGVIIVDAKDPANLIEVGNYDTYTGSGTGFNGAWGAYPFLPSGNILVSDRGNGLHVIATTYVSSARIEGQITDMTTGNPITTANIVIDDSQPNGDDSNFMGDYKTGIAASGTFNVTVSAPGYYTKVVSATLVNGIAVTVDVQLEPLNLPIELTAFELTKWNNNQVLLSWEAVANHEFFNFEIERGVDGMNFELIDRIVNEGIAGQEKSFEFIDRTVPEGKIYYRIKLIDPDLTFKYSMIKSVDFKNSFENQISIFPNPVDDSEHLNIFISKTSEKIFVSILNAAGQTIYKSALNTGTSNIIAAENIAKGLNLVVIEGSNRVIKSEQIVR